MLLSDHGSYQGMRFRQIIKQFINFRNFILIIPKYPKNKNSPFSLILNGNHIESNSNKILVLDHRPRLGGFGTFGPLCGNTGNQFFLNVTNVFSPRLIAAYVWLHLLVSRKSDYCRRGRGVISVLPNFWWRGWEGSGCPREYLSGNAQLSRASPTDARPHSAPFCWWRGSLISAYLTPTLLTDGGDGGWREAGNMWPGDAESGEMEARDEKAFQKKRRQIQEKLGLSSLVGQISLLRHVD